jgi:hypothetical protein
MIKNNRIVQKISALAAAYAFSFVNAAHADNNPSTNLSCSIRRSTELSPQRSAVIVTGSIASVVSAGQLVVASVANFGERSVVA